MSIDAMGTQREIAGLIVQRKGHYLLAVKENQRSLYEDVECAFKMNSGTDVSEEVDAGHGRIETRKCSILPANAYLMDETLEAWKGLSCVSSKTRQHVIPVTTSAMRRKRKQPITQPLQEGTGVLRINFIGIWTLHSEKMPAGRGKASPRRICLSSGKLHYISYQDRKTG